MGLLAKLKPLQSDQKQLLLELSPILNSKRIQLIKKLVKEKKVILVKESLKTSLANSLEFPQIKVESDEVDAADVNSDIRKAFEKKLFEQFSRNAFEIISSFVAPHITGMESAKKAAAIQLFSNQPLHILLLGDPGTGKTDILRSIFNMSPISSFGLGSGTSGAGLVVTMKGKEIMKGLLPLADKGICCIDELNLLKEESRAGLYNAMEKGFVSYDKGGAHFRFDSRVRVISTANPKGDKFIGNDIGELKKQLPFDAALLTRFHLIFFIRKPDLETFKKITKSMVDGDHKELEKNDIDFVKDYITSTLSIEEVDFPKPLQSKVVDFIAELKKNESSYLVEISPRMTLGFMRSCKALARMERRNTVSVEDIERVKSIVRDSLTVQQKEKNLNSSK